MRENERGFLLVDAAISLPILLILIGTFGTLLFVGGKTSYEAYCQAELRYEVQEVMARIVDDMSKAQAVYVESGEYTNTRLKIWQHPLEHEVTNLTTGTDAIYLLHSVHGEQGYEQGIYYGNEHLPIMGASRLARIWVDSFEVRELGGGLYEVTIAARELRTQSAYTLSSTVYVRGGKDDKT